MDRMARARAGKALKKAKKAAKAAHMRAVQLSHRWAHRRGATALLGNEKESSPVHEAVVGTGHSIAGADEDMLSSHSQPSRLETDLDPNTGSMPMFPEDRETYAGSPWPTCSPLPQPSKCKDKQRTKSMATVSTVAADETFLPALRRLVQRIEKDKSGPSRSRSPKPEIPIPTPNPHAQSKARWKSLEHLGNRPLSNVYSSNTKRRGLVGQEQPPSATQKPGRGHPQQRESQE
ncbi:Uu.00g133910.m01.CDS01 [Anthostomella pinea]|uniref:Uu.00g133910.m01.CDS01 n=1 Tax=Anthostomella pinea TaxID=933095 RepID=A0AAI8VQ11_9PEZI|nr:Uu.00g133910.m01.CDS01 [Anthostomella pinea]